MSRFDTFALTDGIPTLNGQRILNVTSVDIHVEATGLAKVALSLVHLVPGPSYRQEGVCLACHACGAGLDE